MSRTKIHYGWIIVLAGMAVMATSIGIINNCFGLLVVPVCDELGFSREAMGYNQMIFSGGTMLVAIFAGPIFSRLNLKRTMCAAGTVMCASYFLFSVSRTITAFYAVSTLVAISSALVTIMPFQIIIHNWFHDRVGTAMGMTFMGTGLGGMLFNMLGGQLLENMGWRPMVRVFTAILAAVVLPCLFWVVRTRPEDMNLRPYGERDEETAVQGAVYGCTLKQATHTVRFYLVLLGLFVSGLAINAIATTSTPHYTDVLNSPAKASMIASGFMLCLAGGKFALGFLFDKLGARRATFVSFVLLVVALFALSKGANGVFIAVFLVMCGLACAFASVPMGLLAQNVFGTRDYGAITGVFSAVSSFGGMLAPPLCGRICDLTGSYAPAYLALSAAALAVIFPMLLGIPARGRTANASAAESVLR